MEMNLEDYLEHTLEDDHTLTGGISHEGETLEDFITEIEDIEQYSLGDVNEALIECGIKPIR